MSHIDRTARRLGPWFYGCVFFVVLNLGFAVLNAAIGHWYMVPVSLLGVAFPAGAAVYVLRVRGRLS